MWKRKVDGEKITLPYLDGRIDPDDIEFDEEKPSQSLLRNSSGCKERKYEGGTYLIYEKNPLGKGNFGEVFLAQNKTTKQWIAIKIPRGSRTPKLEEIQSLESTGNLVFFDKHVGMKLLEGQSLVAIVDDGIHKPVQKFSLQQKLAIAKSILKNMAHLHHDVRYMRGERKWKVKTIHRDVKSANIILDASTLTARFGDYGLATTLGGVPIVKKKPTKSEPDLKLMSSIPRDNNITENNLYLYYDKTSDKIFYTTKTGTNSIKRSEIKREEFEYSQHYDTLLEILKKLNEEVDIFGYFSHFPKMGEVEDVDTHIKAELINIALKSGNFHFEDTRPTLGEIRDEVLVKNVYMAPEIYSGMSVKPSQHFFIMNFLAENAPPIAEYNEATEVYALGVTLAEMFGIAQCDPADHRYTFHTHPPDVPDSLYKLISQMLDNEPKNRPTVVMTVKRLNAIFHREGNTETATIGTTTNVCIISIDEFLQYPLEKKIECIKSISDNNINAIVLQGSDKTSNLDYYKVRYYLTQKGIISIAPFMAKGSPEAVLCIAKNHYDQTLCTINTKVFTYNAAATHEMQDETNKIPKNEQSSTEKVYVTTKELVQLLEEKKYDKIIEHVTSDKIYTETLGSLVIQHRDLSGKKDVRQAGGQLLLNLLASSINHPNKMDSLINILVEDRILPYTTYMLENLKKSTVGIEERENFLKQLALSSKDKNTNLYQYIHDKFLPDERQQTIRLS
jgi:serine/threonine protein kinase